MVVLLEDICTSGFCWIHVGKDGNACSWLENNTLGTELESRAGVANCFRDMCATSPMVAKLCEMPKISETKPTLDKRQTDGPYSDYVAC